MAGRDKEREKMHLLDDLEETKSGMYLSVLADGPGEAEAAMVLNSLVDDPEELKKDADRIIKAIVQDEDTSDIE